jgi:hypothetical protein
LTDEGESVLNFLDDCVQRCAKATHRYIEEMEEFASQSGAGAGSGNRAAAHSLNASPLLMTVFEQLKAKIKGNLFSSSDELAIWTYVRILVSSLIGKQHAGELSFFVRFTDRVMDVMQAAAGKNMCEGEDTVKAWLSEGGLLKQAVRSCTEPGYTPISLGFVSETMSEDVDIFLRGVEKDELRE